MKAVRRSVEFPGVLYEQLLKDKRGRIVKTSIQSIVIQVLMERYGLTERGKDV